MNIMLVNVTERTREIGIRLAIGAKGRHVLLQFLLEAIALSVVGGAIGVALGLLITSIALFVGGVGVMNVMFVSVTERTREIGIRKAIGAKRRSILLQFLFESSIICLFGGIIGIAISAVITAVLNATLMPASLSPFIILVALVVSVFTGVVAGMIPAWRGAKLDPIEALRYE
jgi:putative ABC transport system permease protein